MINNSEQLSLINEQPKADNAPVVCLGITFENDEARRRYFLEELRKKLPELKKMEGFPVGEDEDIIALSDPPYYTVCPNPWINDFIEEWEREKIEKYGQNIDEHYHREPFAADVSEGKYDTMYKLHPFPTKVPHKAIMKYILHYTKPGDIIMDGFSGTGMTGVAAQECGNKEAVKSLQIDQDDLGNIEIGERKVILNDLSTIATFLSYQHNKKIDYEYKKAQEFLKKVEDEYNWAFLTLHHGELLKNKANFASVDELKQFINENSEHFGYVNSVLWSDVFECNYCQEEIIFWDNAVIQEEGRVKKEFSCPNCNSNLVKRSLKRIYTEVYDEILDDYVSYAKQAPIKVNYSFNGKKFEKKLDVIDYEIINKISLQWEKSNIPVYKLKDGVNTKQPKISHKFEYAHQFYSKRNLLILARYQKEISMLKYGFTLTRVATQITKLYRYTYQSGTWGAGGGPLSGTLYVPSLIKEINIIKQLKSSISQQAQRDGNFKMNNFSISTSSTINLDYIKDNSVDYIFVDPPFGENLMYSEINSLWEYWLKVYTNDKTEAIMNSVQNKGISEYQKFMTLAFEQLYKKLKSDRWITVEFSNTSSAIWNSIQASIQSVGFVIANVSVLDKKKGSFKAVTSTVAVKQDLVISAYKPTNENILKMQNEINTVDSAWTFVSQHLEKLPVFLGGKGEASIIAERTPRILFDRMVAYHVQTGLPIPISSAEFQAGVAQRFPMRDGMAFLESQIAEYDKKRILIKDFSQQSLFVSDENSAIEWIRQQLMKKPQTRQDLHPQFMKEIQHIAKHEQLPELDDLLVQNFLRYEGDTDVPDQIAGYLRRNYREYRGLGGDNDKLKERAINCWYVPDPNKQADLDKLREKTLLREFEGYVGVLGTHKKKLSHFRTEAIRAGFKKAWTEKDYNKIVSVGDRLPETVIQEDDKLLMYYDNAQIRIDM